MTPIFEPLHIKDVTLRNRIAVSPMCQYSSVDGFANDWHLVHLGSRAVGGAGLLVVEATGVSPQGRITPDDLGLWSDAHMEPLQRIVQFVQANGAAAGIQLSHAGRKASHKSPWKGGAALQAEEGAWQTEAPSAIPFSEGEPTPKELDENGIKNIIADFKKAAARAAACGFQVLELHAAHGYLLHEFLSPLSNRRTDWYGGSFQNRIRLLLEVVAAVQEVWPERLPLFVRISATDWADGGWTPDESVALAAELKKAGVDLIDCSSGGNVAHAKIPVGPLYQTAFAERIKQETGIRTAAVGLITTSEEITEILATGKADLVFLARELLRDPYFPLHAAHALGVDLPWPVQYERAKPRTFSKPHAV